MDNYLTPEMFLSLRIPGLEFKNASSLKLQDFKKRCQDMINNNTSSNTKTLLESLISREILLAVLESLYEGIMITDNAGKICYVNNAYLDKTGLKHEDRIGKKISDLSPDGCLANALKLGKPVSNKKTFPLGTEAELIVSANLFNVFGKKAGALANIKEIEDVFGLVRQLRETQTMVGNLSEKLVYLANANYSFNDIIGSSTAIKNVIEMARVASQTDTTVLIQGETGTGKEIIAHSIHNASARLKKPFISVNCSAIPQTLLESEFFGHEKGSFTGAHKRKLGKFELANGGTLFLDEIGDMDLMLQAKILRAIQEKSIQRVGGETRIPLDVRIIAATNRDLHKMIKEGSFREDLYYRLNVWNILILPLRERKEDIEELSKYIIKKICRRLGKRKINISPEAIQVFSDYNWPGNVRELENVLERAVLGSKNKTIIEAKDLDFLNIKKTVDEDDQDSILPLAEVDKNAIKNALKQIGTSYEAKKQISEMLGISVATLYNKIQKYQLAE